MKIGGKKISGKVVKTVYIPKGDNGDEGFELELHSIPSLKPFDNLCPEPIPPTMSAPGKVPEVLINDPDYLKAVTEHNSLRIGWMVIECLKGTKDLEWETVVPDDPKTWDNWQDELSESGMTQGDINRIILGVMAANNLDEDQITAAHQRFLARSH